MSRSLFDRKSRPFLDQTGFFGDHDRLKLFLEQAAASTTFVGTSPDTEPLDTSGVAQDSTQQSYAIQPPSVAAFNPASGFPWESEEAERWVQPQCWPDPTTDLRSVWEPPLNAVAQTSWNEDAVERYVASQLVDDPSAQARVLGLPPEITYQQNIPQDDTYATVDDSTVPAWSIQPPLNVVQSQDFNQPSDDEVQASPAVDDSAQSYAIQPPVVTTVTQLSAWSIEGGEVQDQPVDDPSIQSWSITPPQNATNAQVFNQPEDEPYTTVDDPTVPTYAIQPPPYIPVFQRTSWDGDPDNWQQAVNDDPSVQAWSVGTPQNVVTVSAFNQPDDGAQASPVDDPTQQTYPVQPQAATFDPSTIVWTGRDDIIQPVWQVDDSTSQAWAVGAPVPLGVFNVPQPEGLTRHDVYVDGGSISWAAILATGTTVVGGFPPGGSATYQTTIASASAPVPTGGATASTPGGAGSASIPGGSATTHKPGGS